MKNTKTLKSSRSIKPGQFYKSLAADGYFYLGINYGNQKRLICVNMDELDKQIGYDLGVLFPNNLIKDWEMEECNHSDVEF